VSASYTSSTGEDINTCETPSARPCERANGRLYTELDITLPRELTRSDQVALARAFLDREIGTAHPRSWAVRVRRALDGVERGPAQFFQRAHPTDPTRGGAAKDPAWHHRDKVLALRVAWAETANRALAQAGVAARID